MISNDNYINLSSKNPFLFTDFQGYLELKEKLDFKPLLDIAHLKVSCKTLNLNFLEEFNKISKFTNYFHVSGNDGFSDSNETICNDNKVIKIFENFNFDNKVITLEIYSGIEDIKKSYRYLDNLKSNLL